MFAGDRTLGLESRTRVFWNGNAVGDLTVSTGRVMEENVFHIQAGAEVGSDTLRLVEISDNPHSANEGMSIDLVRIWGH